MSHRHLFVCLALAGTAAVLVAAGAGGFAFLPAIGCALMMGAMIWMMTRGSGGA